MDERMEAQRHAIEAAKQDHRAALLALQQKHQEELSKLFSAEDGNSALCDRLLAVEAEKTQLFVANSVAQRQLARLAAALQSSGKGSQSSEVQALRAAKKELEAEREASLREKRAWLGQLQTENQALHQLLQQAQSSKEELVQEMNDLSRERSANASAHGMEEACAASPLATDTSVEGSALHQQLCEIAVEVAYGHTKHAASVQAAVEAIEWRFVEGFSSQDVSHDVDALRVMARKLKDSSDGGDNAAQAQVQAEALQSELQSKDEQIMELQSELNKLTRLNKALQVQLRRR
jgi:hypothetical protein